MKKILFLLTSPKMGGAEKVIINIANILAERNFDVTLFLFFKKGELFNTISSKVIIDYAYDLEYKSMSISFYKIIYKLLKYRRYDICVAGTEIWPTYIAALLSFIFDIKSISWVHTNLELIIQQYDKIKKIIFNFFNRFSYNKIDKIVLVSNACNSKLFFPEKTVVIPNSYDYEYLKEKSKEKVTDYDFEEDTPVILSVSRLAKVKNIDLLINAHAILKKNGIKQRLLIVGDGEYRKNLEDLCKRLNVENSVTFLGKKNNPYPYFIKSDIFVSASYIEGFSLTGIEAMALKVALIATDLPNACATLIKNHETGLIVANNSLIELKNAIEYFLIHRKEKIVMEKKAYEKVQQYEIHNLNQIILKFFQEVFIS